MGALNKEFKRNDDKMKLHILSKLPEALNEIHTKVSGELNMYDLEKIKTIIREVYERKQLGKKMNTVMHVKGGDPKWKFKGTCYNCGIKGHLARDCQKKPKKEVTCTKCKKKGHYQTQCKSSDEKEESPSQSMFVGNVVENGKVKVMSQANGCLILVPQSMSQRVMTAWNRSEMKKARHWKWQME